MLRKKLVWILGSVTILLLVAVTFVYFFRTDNKKGRTAFLPVNSQIDNGEGETFASKPLAELEKVHLDTISDDFAERYNRSMKSLPDSLELKINEISGIPGEIEIREQIKKQVTETIEIPYEVHEYFVDWLAPGESQVTINGANGIVNILYEEIYYGEELQDRIEISRNVVADAVMKEVAIGIAEQAVSDSADNEQAAVVPETESPAPATPTSPPEPAAPPSAPQSIEFVAPGSKAAAATNLSRISFLMKANGRQSYDSFSDNGDGTITVDGYRFGYTSTSYNTITGYDGVECSETGIPNLTSAGLATTRGIVATVRPEFGGYPFGTMLFIEGYGLVVVGDYNGMGAEDPSWLDVCYYDNEIATAGIDPGRSTRRVYLLSTN